MLLSILLLLFGFVLLIKGADFLVDGASSLAVRMRISPLVVGLTIVSFGTSTPELVVNALAAIRGNAALSFGNIIGSNIINILLILGVAALVRPVETHKNTVWREIPYSLLAVIALILLCNDAFFAGGVNQLARHDGLVLLLFFVIFVTYTFDIPKIDVEELPIIQQLSTIKIVLLIGAGLAGLFFGGKFVVDNAIVIAQHFGLSDKIIGLTIVAIGTSLPELFTSAVASYKGKAEIAVGNVVGSNIFNIFFILAVTAIIRPMGFDFDLNIDLGILVVASLALFFSVFIGRHHRISRGEALLFLILYALYTIYLFAVPRA